MCFDRRAIAMTLAIVGMVASNGLHPGTAEAGRLVYKIEVTNPGTKSQGWYGTLYDAKSLAIVAKPGESIEIAVGRFVSVECVVPWQPCGMIHMATIPVLNESNVILDGIPIEYNLYVTAEGTKSEGWQGTLRRDGVAIEPQADRVLSPMGYFIRADSPNIWGRHGWFPESWGNAK